MNLTHWKVTLSQTQNRENGLSWTEMDMAAATYRLCNETNETDNNFGACGDSGERLHCFSHCPEFMLADPDERLQQVRMYDSCTICLRRNHSTAYHVNTEPEGKQWVCGLYCMKKQVDHSATVASMQPSTGHSLTSRIDSLKPQKKIRNRETRRTR